MDLELFAMRMGEWDLHPLIHHGEITGAVMVKGTEIHVALDQNCRGRYWPRRDLRQLLGGLIQQHGYAITAVMDGNETGHAFVRRLGFEPSGTAPGRIVYRIERLRHG